MTKEINKAVTILRDAGLILYPTDTRWAIGCDATNAEAVNKVYQLIMKYPGEGLVCLVANDFMLEKYVEKVPELAYDIMDISDKPVTIVYDRAKEIAENVLAKDGTLAVRVATDQFSQYLINKYGKPLVATIANRADQAIPKRFDEIDTAILKGVDYVVHLNRESKSNILSSIIKLSNDGSVKVIRE